MKKRALFLDRDGTLIVHRHYLCDPRGVELLPGVQEALLNALESGFLLFLFTNQSGVGRGYFSLDDVEACNDRMFNLVGVSKNCFTGICIATEVPGSPVTYRKPSPRYIIEMSEKYSLIHNSSWMIGDAISDVYAGLAAGINSVLVGSNLPPLDIPASVLCCSDFPEAYRKLSSA